MVTKTPSHANPKYVTARIRKLLAARGWPLSTKSGRYQPFGGTQVVTEGFDASKVGCSKSVSIRYCPALRNGRSSDLPKGVAAARVAEAVEYLRSLGYRVDDRGRIECDGYDDCDR